MKAILVVDLPEEYVGSVIDVKLYSKTNVVHEYHEQYVNKLKLMPEKMKVNYDTVATCEVTEKVVAMGWNACIDEILGDEDE